MLASGMLSMSVFRLMRSYGRLSPKASVALRTRTPPSTPPNFCKYPRDQTRLYSEYEYRPNIIDKIERCFTSRTSEVIWSLAVFLWLGGTVHDHMHASHRAYMIEGVSKAFDCLVDLDWHKSQTAGETTSQFLTIVLTVGWSIFPEGFQRASSGLAGILEICGGAAVPIMFATCKDVATVMSALPKSGVDIKEKAKVIERVRVIVAEALKELIPIHQLRVDRMLVDELQQMLQRELAKEKMGKFQGMLQRELAKKNLEKDPDSYSVIG